MRFVASSTVAQNPPAEGLAGTVHGAVYRSADVEITGPIEGAEPDVDLPPPWLGEHTDSILTELGYDQAEIAALHERGDV